MEKPTNSLIDAFKVFKEEKSIDRTTVAAVLKDVLITQIVKTYGSADNFQVIVNVDKGTCQIFQDFDIVEQVENPATEMTLEDIPADEVEDFEIGDTYTKVFKLEDFGRRGILNIRQLLQGRIMDIEKANVYKTYSERVGELYRGQIYQTWSREVLILDEDGNELHLPKSEQIRNEHLKKGQEIRAIIKSVEMKNNTTPYITLSRTSPVFLERLFEQEVPEVADGLITIKKVVREDGIRAKVAVESYDERIDPVGACIGVKGSRINGIVRELSNENIDVIPWSSNPQIMIARALAPAKVISVDMTRPGEKVRVVMPGEDVNKAIGKAGVNIKLTGMLIDREIDVYRELTKEEQGVVEDDVELQDFANEIDQWIIDRLKEIGCDTARDVLAISPEDLANRADLEDETVEEIMTILKSEFKDE